MKRFWDIWKRRWHPSCVQSIGLGYSLSIDYHVRLLGLSAHNINSDWRFICVLWVFGGGNGKYVGDCGFSSWQTDRQTEWMNSTQIATTADYRPISDLAAPCDVITWHCTVAHYTYLSPWLKLRSHRYKYDCTSEGRPTHVRIIPNVNLQSYSNGSRLQQYEYCSSTICINFVDLQVVSAPVLFQTTGTIE